MIGFDHKRLGCQSIFYVNKVRTLDLVIGC